MGISQLSRTFDNHVNNATRTYQMDQSDELNESKIQVVKNPFKKSWNFQNVLVSPQSKHALKSRNEKKEHHKSKLSETRQK